MISVAEIHKKAEKLYPEVLRAALTAEPIFPRSIRADKSLSLDFAQMSKEIEAIMTQSKDRKGYGYTVRSQSIRTKRHGYQDIPSDIVFESLNDYLNFLQKEKQYKAFLEDAVKIESQIPQLRTWVLNNPLSVINHLGTWSDLLKVCDWFLNHFEAHTYYIRELPIAVHTKFIEDHKAILKSLLEELIPEKLNLSESSFERRLRLKYPQPIIRYRSGRNVLKNNDYTDIAIPLDQFIATNLSCDAVFIVENLMNFLTFPLSDDAIIVWGKGFAIESLKEVKWFSDRSIFCWSDLDVQGFQMLSQLRGYFPQTTSLLMDKQTLDLFKGFAGSGTPSQVKILNNLSLEEHQLFDFLAKDNIRLEQERIPQWYIVEFLEKLGQLIHVQANH